MKILFVSLGCDKNLVDSEEMLGDLTKSGYEITDDEEAAEAAIVNTCCFINDAKKESIDSILELAPRRTGGQLKALVVTGCLAQRYSEEIRKEIPEQDAALVRLNDLKRMPRADVKRVLTTANGSGYLRIAEGCSKYCTYCVIPSIRGPYRSVPMEQVLKTAEDLAAQGVREIILVAQETTLYGTDLYGEKKLPDLLRELAKIDGIHWIRLLYCYPEEITPELIRTMRDEPKVLHYIDMPPGYLHSDDPDLGLSRRAGEGPQDPAILCPPDEI